MQLHTSGHYEGILGRMPIIRACMSRKRSTPNHPITPQLPGTRLWQRVGATPCSPPRARLLPQGNLQRRATSPSIRMSRRLARCASGAGLMERLRCACHRCYTLLPCCVELLQLQLVGTAGLLQATVNILSGSHPADSRRSGATCAELGPHASTYETRRSLIPLMALSRKMLCADGKQRQRPTG